MTLLISHSRCRTVFIGSEVGVEGCDRSKPAFDDQSQKLSGDPKIVFFSSELAAIVEMICYLLSGYCRLDVSTRDHQTTLGRFTNKWGVHSCEYVED